MKKLILFALILSLSSIAFAVDKPSLAEIKKVLSYYYNGQGEGVVLVDKKLCESTYKEGDEKFNCMNELVDASLNKGEKAIVWMNFFGPVDEKYSLLVQFVRNGITRHSVPLKITGSIRYRANAALVTNSAGKWEIKIYHDGDEKADLLGTVNYTVSKD